MWGQLAAKALISGVLVAAASELARRSPGWGGLVASLPLVSFLTMLWLWRDGVGAERIGAFALSSTFYVLATMPAFVLLVVLLRRGVGIPLGIGAFVLACFAGYLVLLWAGRRWALPV